MSCKDYITDEKQIIALDEIQKMNSRRIYNQGVYHGYLFLLVVISNLTKGTYYFRKKDRQ